jgi:small-conductance mechanosensitive channel
MGVLAPVKRFILSLSSLIVGILIIMFFFDELVAKPANFDTIVRQSIDLAMIVASSAIALFLIRRFKASLSKRTDPHAATAFSFFMGIITAIVAFLAVLHILQVSAEALLIGGGLVTIILGLILSTLLGNMFAGVLMLMSNPFRVGDNVLVNNIPGRVEEITSMFTRIRNDSGGETIVPNSALIQGVVVITKAPQTASTLPRLPYSLGDRIYTAYVGGEGVVTEVTPFHTKVLLDSEREITIPNNSVLTGTIQVARITGVGEAVLSFSLRIDWDVENTIRAMKEAVNSDPATFKSPLTVHYSSLDGKTVELKVSCVVDPKKKNEAKSTILRTAYLTKE